LIIKRLYFLRTGLRCIKIRRVPVKVRPDQSLFFQYRLVQYGRSTGQIGEFLCQALIQSGIKPDILYGPAYKGIPLVSATSIAYAQVTGKDIPFAFNRKEVKDHGEGGSLVGAPFKARLLFWMTLLPPAHQSENQWKS